MSNAVLSYDMTMIQYLYISGESSI